MPQHLLLRFLLLAFLCLPANAQEIILVRGTSSAPDEAEQNYARTVTTNLTRWLTNLYLPHKVINDEEVSTDSLKDARVVILGYNPKLPSKELAAFRTFTEKGGKFIVFYSSDPGLAKLMDMKIGQYMWAETGGRWELIRFNASAPAYLPKIIIQGSHNIRPVYPLPGKSKVIAYWEDAAGKSSADPAWVQSKNGFWMSHILLDDGDTGNKEQMLLALIAHCSPSAWTSAASYYLLESSTLPGYRTFKDTEKSIAARAINRPSEPKVKSILGEASGTYLEMKQLFSEKKYPEVVGKSRILAGLLNKAFACVQDPAPRKFRGIWEQEGLGLYPGDWERTCKLIADNGFTDVLPNMLSHGIAHYKSTIYPPSLSFRAYGDQLSKCIEAAHKNGLRIHVWKSCWRIDSAPDDFTNKMKKADRLMVSSNGNTAEWLCPSNPDNLRHEKDSVRELLQNYQVDGIQLDFIRFKDSHTCFCAGCRSRFEKDTGRKAVKWPIPADNSELRKEFNRWRCEQITRLVRDVRAIARTMKPEVKISAAVYGYYPQVSESIAQDWGSWLKEGLVDFVCPMNYVDDADQFRKLVQKQMALPSAANRIYPGIGITASESRLTPIQAMEQLTILRKEGATGFALFDLNQVLAIEFLPLLRLGATAPE